MASTDLHVPHCFGISGKHAAAFLRDLLHDRSPPKVMAEQEEAEGEQEARDNSNAAPHQQATWREETMGEQDDRDDSHAAPH